MVTPEKGNAQQADFIDPQVRQQLEAAFSRLPNDIHVHLFTKQGEDSIFSQAARQSLNAFGSLSPRIVITEHDLGDEAARRWGVDRSPTFLIEPEKYAIRWLGAPVGEEGRTFLEALFFVGLGKGNLNEQSLKVLQKLDAYRQVKVFVSPSCPYCPQQAVNALKAAIEKPDLVSLDIVDIQFFPDIADQYAAQSVPQTFANEVLIGKGAQQEELFMLSLQKLNEETIFIPESEAKLVEADLVIVGGGPAGLTAAIYAVRSGLKAVLIERGSLGGQVSTTPVVENYPGLTQVGGKTLVDIMVNHALQYVQIFQGEPVLDIEPGQPIQVATNRRRFHTKTVLLATGATNKKLGIPGEERLSGRGISYCATCDGPLFKNKKAVVVGGGNTAATEALHLYHQGVDVTLIHRRNQLRAQDYLTKSLYDTGIPILWNTEVREIRGKERVEEILIWNNQTNEQSLFRTDGVFVAIGFEPAVDLAKKLGVELTPDGYVKTVEHHRTNIPGIYVAGDVEGGFKQIVTAAGQGSAAALSIFEDLINPYWKQGGLDAGRRSD